MNSIDKVINIIEDLARQSSGPASAAYCRTADIVRKECSDLLGKPLVDARGNPNKPLRSLNCKESMANVCTIRTEEECLHGNKRPADCPVDWSVEP